MRRQNLIARIALASALALAGTVWLAPEAFAQKKGGSKKGKLNVIDFNEDNVHTTYLKPVETIETLNTGKRSSLIRIRRDFIAEIIKTAEDL